MCKSSRRLFDSTAADVHEWLTLTLNSTYLRRVRTLHSVSDLPLPPHRSYPRSALARSIYLQSILIHICHQTAARLTLLLERLHVDRPILLPALLVLLMSTGFEVLHQVTVRLELHLTHCAHVRTNIGVQSHVPAHVAYRPASAVAQVTRITATRTSTADDSLRCRARTSSSSSLYLGLCE